MNNVFLTRARFDSEKRANINVRANGGTIGHNEERGVWFVDRITPFTWSSNKDDYRPVAEQRKDFDPPFIG